MREFYAKTLWVLVLFLVVLASSWVTLEYLNRGGPGAAFNQAIEEIEQWDQRQQKQGK